MGGGGRTPILRPPGEAGELPRIEFDRPLVPTPEIVADPFPAALGSQGLGGVDALARLGEGALPLPSVLNPPDISSLVPAPEALAPSRFAGLSGFFTRLWEGLSRYFGLSNQVSVSEEGVALLAARRAIDLDPTSGQQPSFSLSDPNPLVRVRNKLELDMPGSETLETFLNRTSARVSETQRSGAATILSILTNPATLSLPVTASLRAEVAAEVRVGGGGYQSRYQIAEVVRVVLRRHGLDFPTPSGSATMEQAALESVFQNLSLHLLPDDVPVYRTIASNVVNRSGGGLSMAANLDGMTYWGVGSEGVAVTRTYVDEGHILVTTTIGELRALGVLTTDDIAIAGNAVELYHQPAESGGWRPVPVTRVRNP